MEEKLKPAEAASQVLKLAAEAVESAEVKSAVEKINGLSCGENRRGRHGGMGRNGKDMPSCRPRALPLWPLA